MSAIFGDCQPTPIILQQINTSGVECPMDPHPPRHSMLRQVFLVHYDGSICWTAKSLMQRCLLHYVVRLAQPKQSWRIVLSRKRVNGRWNVGTWYEWWDLQQLRLWRWLSCLEGTGYFGQITRKITIILEQWGSDEAGGGTDDQRHQKLLD